MPVCKKIRGQKRQVCIGDKDNLITIQSRNIQTPGTLDPNNKFYFTEAFSNIEDFEAWAMIKTVSGETLFDDTNQAIDITHHLYVYFDENITAEKWVTLESGDRLDIIDVENLDERGLEMLLRCSNRGPASNSNNDV